MTACLFVGFLLFASPGMPYGWPEDWSESQTLGRGVHEHGFRVADGENELFAYWVKEGREAGEHAALTVAPLSAPSDAFNLRVPWGDDGPASGEFFLFPEDGVIFWIEQDDGWHLRGGELDLTSGEFKRVETIYSSAQRLRYLAVMQSEDSYRAIWSERFEGALQIRTARVDGSMSHRDGPRTVTSSGIPSRFPFLAAVEDSVLLGWADQRPGGVSEIRLQLLNEDSESSVKAASVTFSEDHGRPRAVGLGVNQVSRPRFLVVWSGGHLQDGIPTDRAVLACRIVEVDSGLTAGPVNTLLQQRGLDAVHLFPDVHARGEDVAFAWSQQNYNRRYDRTDVSGYFVSTQVDDGLLTQKDEPLLLTYGFRSALRPQVFIDEEGNHHYLWQVRTAGGFIDIHYANTKTPAQVTRWNVLGIDADRIIPSAVFQVILAVAWSVARMGRELPLLLLFSVLVWIIYSQSFVESLSSRWRAGLLIGVGLLYCALSYSGVLILSMNLWGMQPVLASAIVAAGITSILMFVLCEAERERHWLSNPLGAVGCLMLWVFWNSYFQLLFVPLALR